MSFRSVGYQQLTSLSAAASLTIPSGTTHVWLQAEDQDVRFRADADPTATTGAVLRADDPPIELPVDAVASMTFIEATATAKLNVLYWGHA